MLIFHSYVSLPEGISSAFNVNIMISLSSPLCQSLWSLYANADFGYLFVVGCFHDCHTTTLVSDPSQARLVHRQHVHIPQNWLKLFPYNTCMCVYIHTHSYYCTKLLFFVVMLQFSFSLFSSGHLQVPSSAALEVARVRDTLAPWRHGFKGRNTEK